MQPDSISRVLITGANGCLGKQISNYFLKYQNLHVTNLVRSKINNIELNKKNEFILSDINSITYLEKNLKNIDIVIHLAFPNNKKYFSKKQIEKLVYINNQFFNLMIKKNIKKFIYLSTSKINSYESLSASNLYNYETCKLQIEHNLFKLSQKNKTNLIIIRSGIVYGPKIENNLNKFVSYIKSGKKIPLINDQIYKNIIFIDYFLEGIHFLLNSNRVYSKINYLYERNINLRELVNVINSILDRKNNIIVIPKIFLDILKIIKLYKLIFKSLYDSFYIKEKSFYEIEKEQMSNKKFEENLIKSFNLNKI